MTDTNIYMTHTTKAIAIFFLMLTSQSLLAQDKSDNYSFFKLYKIFPQQQLPYPVIPLGIFTKKEKSPNEY